MKEATKANLIFPGESENQSLTSDILCVFTYAMVASRRLRAILRWIVAATGILLLGGSVGVHGAEATTEAEIRALHQQYDAAWAKQDAEAFERLLAPDFEVVETDGQVTSRAAVIANARDGSLKFRLGESRDVRIVSHDGTAVVRGLWRGRGAFRDKAFDELSRYTTTYSKVGGQWKVLADQTTKVTAAAAVTQLHERFMQAKGEVDAASVATLYTKDAWEVSPNQPIVRGRAAIEEDTRSYFKSLREEKIRVELTNLEVEEFGGWAYNLGRYKNLKADGTVTDEGTFMGIWKLEDGEWKLHRDFVNTILPKKDK